MHLNKEDVRLGGMTNHKLESDIHISLDSVNKTLKWDKSAHHLEHILKTCNAFVAGGFAVHLYSVHNKFVSPGYSDIDIFFTSQEDLLKARDYLISQLVAGDPGIKQANDEVYPGETERAITYSVGDKLFQLIKIRMGEMPEVLGTFDFENSKAAFCWDDETKDYRMTYSSILTELLVEKKVSFRIQNYECKTPEEKKQRALANMSRLDRYLIRYPGGFYDVKSREEILFQYLWNMNNVEVHKSQKRIRYLLHNDPLGKILQDNETGMEQLVMFVHLGPEIATMMKNHGKPRIDHPTTIEAVGEYV